MKNDESLDEKSDEFWSAFRKIRYARERKKERKFIHPSWTKVPPLFLSVVEED
jgi:hypothetical protein